MNKKIKRLKLTKELSEIIDAQGDFINGGDVQTDGQTFVSRNKDKKQTTDDYMDSTTQGRDPWARLHGAKAATYGRGNTSESTQKKIKQLNKLSDITNVYKLPNVTAKINQVVEIVNDLDSQSRKNVLEIITNYLQKLKNG